ncbi:unnamed protein product [Staurois parvus]|uniref:Uncharacterized protein n=1 Tax=Staurois parvus TaxID=386267 RepID=A0ABN9HPS1_9NEOB|nr:unnamed protein product [Staurois parvus]
MGPLCPCPHPKKPMKKANERYQGHHMGPPTDLGQCPIARMVSPPLVIQYTYKIKNHSYLFVHHPFFFFFFFFFLNQNFFS